METIKTLFDNNVYFEVPSYQRAYSWRKEQLDQFVEDLKDSKGCRYHLGHFLFECKKYEKDKEVRYVIDGQQRLTTCVIFFSALSSVLRCRKKEGDVRGDIDKYILSIEDRYLVNKTSCKQKFQTVSYDIALFKSVVIDGDLNVFQDSFTTKSQTLIFEAFKYFSDLFNNTSTDEVFALSSALEGAMITTCNVESKLEAVQIFSYQNDRGRSLTNLDVLKAYFMQLIYESACGEDDINQIEGLFEDIYRNIVQITVDEDDVLNYYWRAVSEKGYNSEKTVPEAKNGLKIYLK